MCFVAQILTQVVLVNEQAEVQTFSISLHITIASVRKEDLRIFILDFHRGMNTDSLLEIYLMTIEDGTHSGSQNVVGKFILHTVQNPQKQESRSVKLRNYNLLG